MVCARSPRSMAGGKSNMGEIETEPIRPKVTDAKGILKQNREFLDFFWDIAKPEQEIRLQAIENLVQYLKNSEKKLVRNAAFGNFFGVLSLSQSGRLTKEPRVVLESVQLLQSLAQFREHLKDLPRKTMVDILSETPEAVFEEVLLGALKSDLSSAFSTPEQLHLLLVAIQRFPGVLKPKKLKNLLGASSVVTADNIPKLVEVLKTAAKSVKKDRTMPPVGLDLLKVALKENSFDLFWKEAVINGLLKDQLGPSSYMCYRLLGSALPLLSFSQLKCVLGGEVMKHYGEHVVTAQLPDRFKFAPEMESYVDSFLEGCPPGEKQFAVMVAFSSLTNQGYPVVPSYWKVVRHLQLPVLLRYVDWLKDMFSNPQLDTCMDFSTKRQQQNQEKGDRMLQSVEALNKKAKKSQNMETAAFQQLFLLVGIHLFKTPEESVELINDLQNCLENAQEKKSKKKKATASSEDSEEPQWVEVMVEILLTLLSQPSRLMRQVSKTVFGRMCPHVTQRALQIILDVLDPEKDEEESGVVVTDQKDSRKQKKEKKPADNEEELFFIDDNAGLKITITGAALYLVRVLKGNASDTPAATPAGKSKKQKKVEAETAPTDQSMCVGSLDKERVAALFQAALTDFMTRRKSSLSGAMFIDLFIRFPILCVQLLESAVRYITEGVRQHQQILCVQLLESAVRYITEGVRQHQQGQACALVQKALQMREVRQSMTDTEWTELIGRAVGQVTECLKTVTGFKVKVDQEKVIQCLELTRFLIRTAQQQKLAVSVTELGPVLESLSQLEGFRKSGHVDDTYWNVMKLLGFSYLLYSNFDLG
ncbi:UNVERIFIED_CONTAM: hypothetical protein FKN15_066835 [Acipenser sinensis]